MRLILFLTTILLLTLPLSADRGLKMLKKMKEEQRIALIIGNNDYKKLSRLKNPINDARSMREALKKRGFEVIYKENATKRDMKKLIKEFTYKLKRGGVGLYYFAGHGINVNGNNYLVATNSEMDSKEDVEYEAYALNRITAKMQEAKNRLNIVILDACRNDPFSRSAGGGLAPIGNAKGLFVAYATEAGSVAADGSGSHGVFTKHLIKHMNEQGATIERVFKNVRVGVQNDTQGKQSPGVYNQITGDFYFTLPNKLNGTTLAVSSKQTNQSHKSDKASDAEKEFWTEVKAEDTKEYYEMYLREYPNGYYVDKASHKIEALIKARYDAEIKEAKSLWLKIKGDKYRDRFDEFIIKYPESKYVKLAKLKTKKYPSSPLFMDNQTGLMWLDNNEAKTVQRDWKGAKAYCDNLSYAGFSDWYLPDNSELSDMHGKKHKFKNFSSGYYWSSSIWPNDSQAAWRVSSSDGDSYNGDKNYKNYVRCVRNFKSEKVNKNISRRSNW